MNGNTLVSKIAKLAVSKAAAFTYAVAVGVAGNLAYNIVQQHREAAASAPAAVHATLSPRPEIHDRLIGSAPIPPVRHDEGERGRVSAAPQRHKPAPAEPAPTAAAPLPELPDQPASLDLPKPDSLPAPALKPAALPALPPPQPEREPTASARPIDASAPPVTAGPAAAPEAVVKSSEPAAASTPAEPHASAAIALPPLGKAIDVAPLPASPEPETATAPAPKPGAPELPSPGSKQPSHSLELSDVWHPGRAVAKGLHWVGDQMPEIGGTPPRHAPALNRPISLLPSGPDAAGADAAGKGPASSSAGPGPGSGGLY